MTKATSSSSDGLPTPEFGATDAPWQPSWLHWLISALSGTVEIEKQTAWLKKSNEERQMRHEEWLRKERKNNEEQKMRHEEWLRKEQQKTEELRRENERLAELESRLDAVLPKSASS